MTTHLLIGRRVATIDDIERPGDYCGPIKGFTGDKEACFYVLPNADGLHISHVTFPPHTYRECPDGSLEIRASILHGPDFHNIYVPDGGWHGYLDEGHVWREC